MNINIHNSNDLIQLQKEYKVKLASKARKLLVRLIKEGYKKGEEYVCINIHMGLLPVSYASVPAMLARTLYSDVDYLHVQCKLIYEYFRIVASDVKHPSSFRARLLAGLLLHKRFKVTRDKVPPSYRSRPKFLAKDLQSEVAGRIATIAKPDYIIWKIKKED